MRPNNYFSLGVVSWCILCHVQCVVLYIYHNKVYTEEIDYNVRTTSIHTIYLFLGF